MNSITKFEKIVYCFLFIMFILGIYLSHKNLTYFDDIFTWDDGFVENLTVIFLLSSSFLILYRFIKLFKYKKTPWQLCQVVLILLFFFAAGEELSWGHRFFNLEPSQFFVQHNEQREINFHNLVIGGVNINKLIFSQLLTLVLILYLIILPILFRKFERIKNLVNKCGVPIVKWHHTAAFLIATFLLLFVNSSRKWELYELAFGVIFFLIFLNPLNKKIYSLS